MNELKQYTTVIFSITRGQLWQDKLKHFHDKIVIPIFYYFDEVNLENYQGSHSTENKIASMYIYVASLPPTEQAKIKNVLLAQVIYASDIKEFKKRVIFLNIVVYLVALETKGINIRVNIHNKFIFVHFFF